MPKKYTKKSPDEAVFLFIEKFFDKKCKILPKLSLKNRAFSTGKNQNSIDNHSCT